MAETTGAEILALPMEENDAGARTIRDYLVTLLTKLWEEGEGFSGKRPFGNSGWEFELYTALGLAGVVGMTFDDDGFVDRFLDGELRRADQLIYSAIVALH